MTMTRERSPKLGKVLYTLLAILVLAGTSACSSLQDLLPLEQAAPSEEQSGVEPAAQALVTFRVKIPADTPPDQPILISILDEVTGLALNAQRHPMKAGEDGEYILGLPFPVGTTVKYRYSRRGEVLAEEHTTDGRAVRYRIFQVQAPSEVQDVVSRWNDTPFTGGTGRISGQVTDKATAAPLPGLLVTAGGAQAFTASDGGFLIEGLPPGTHNLVVYAPNGAHRTYQHQALVAVESTTPAPVQMEAAPKVDITFILHVPQDTPPVVPIRLAGNLTQLGNTFADLSGGISTLASRMPVLSSLPDGTYGVILGLPAGANLAYKYTLGDGFWNTERAANGDWVIRQLTVPETATVIEDSIETWHVGEAAPITFDLHVPANTPADEGVFIQFDPYGWTEPLPMWPLGQGRWAYILYSPLDKISQLGYRYCRAGQCGQADDARTPGPRTEGQLVQTSTEPQGLPDEVPSWAWWGEKSQSSLDLSQVKVAPRGPSFFAGVEFMEEYHPSWMARTSSSLQDVSASGANGVVLTPTWTFTRSNPPVLEPVTRQDPMWMETVGVIKKAQQSDLQVTLRPVPHFPTPVDEWWGTAPRDFPWWVSWFDRYTAFAIHYADLAERSGVQTLILGGDWLSPALPEGLLADGSRSGVPEDADSRYRELIAQVRAHFSGTLGWAFTYPRDLQNPPGFMEAVDMVYLLWSLPLSEEVNPGIEDLQAKANQAISVDLYAHWLSLQLDSTRNDLVIALAYPSVAGGTTVCLADPLADCIPPEDLKTPAPDYPLLDLDLDQQARAYHAMLGAIAQAEWIDGVTSRGYYPPALLQDKSTSIHGKPAEEVLRAWYGQFVAETP